ncbi:MAG: hypothetical protein ACXWLR_05620 [Myxococcales bacterium]
MKLWTIREEQLAALQAVYERRFADRAVAYVRRRYPRSCASLDEGSIRASVETALQKRATYRFDSEETFYAYLDLMYLLGFDFDRDPRCAWAQERLTDFDLGARTRLLLLVEEARSRTDRAGEAAARS